MRARSLSHTHICGRTHAHTHAFTGFVTSRRPPEVVSFSNGMSASLSPGCSLPGEIFGHGATKHSRQYPRTRQQRSSTRAAVAGCSLGWCARFCCTKSALITSEIEREMRRVLHCPRLLHTPLLFCHAYNGSKSNSLGDRSVRAWMCYPDLLTIEQNSHRTLLPIRLFLLNLFDQFLHLFFDRN